MKCKKGLVFGVVLLALSACGKTTREYYRGQDGATGSTGAQGPQGDKGDTGDAGQDGTNGIDATSVTVVKLCPGVTTYPSKFVEVAFCIGGKLYGTYSANDGFSTELVPGTYLSNGINASCNATIGSNCSVSN